MTMSWSWRNSKKVNAEIIGNNVLMNFYVQRRSKDEDWIKKYSFKFPKKILKQILDDIFNAPP